MPPISRVTGSTEAPKQLKQTSRKGKKAWRKHVDVTDIQKGLEAGVEEEILFGGKLANHENTDLFQLDTKGSEELSKKFNLKPKSKRLRADEIIAERSAVPAVSSKKRQAYELVPGMVPEKRRRKDRVSQKELSRLRDVADGKHEASVEVVDATYDAWADEAHASTTSVARRPKTITKDGEELDFLPEPKPTKAPKSMSRQPISLAANGKPIPAVSKPSGGFSYNPNFNEYMQRYNALSESAVATEKERLEQEARDKEKRIATAKSAAEAEAAEARADLSEWEEDTEWEGFESDGEAVTKKTKRAERKTPVQRNKVKRRKEEERRKKHETSMNRRDEQAKMIKQIAKEVAERDRQLALQRADESSADDGEEGSDELLRRKHLGKAPIPDKDLDLVLPDELQDSLRLLKPEGNLLKDRYRNLLVRGKFEARRRIPFKRQARVKWTEKWTHKDFRVLL
ncbi:hypothetical protein MKZ38_006148 [Zalerion maritima]|uniref:Ribosome biogenesis protein NOP53 n=1 Tax=Zalerion maritima TaxID=339359 RepID=A0AAD5RJ93_9PEZI|nr:hypothetical protein MKZ38_006148 [Zalerion maritima]